MEELDEQCREGAYLLMKQFLLDHLRDRTLDQLTYEVLSENLEDYI